MAPAGITTRHHRPSTSPTSSNVGITCSVYARRNFGRTPRLCTEKAAHAGAREHFPALTFPEKAG